MAVAPTMNLNNNNEDSTIINLRGSRNNNNDEENINTNKRQQEEQEEEDEHEHDTVMPGFRFHPTEEELVEFYLRRKVEGKKFNVELINFLDLYRYDPWELPNFATVGEKEWFFYVPRDRKYRNGDRPNRVTTSGYWKATGADRMIRAENFRPIGLKKTLVFYSGKAPKGIRTSWIMNEYRLPQHETERFQKAEISLCRVYKRAGVEDHPSLPWGGPLSNKKHHHRNQQQPPPAPPPQLPIIDTRNLSETPTDASSSTEVGTALGLSQQHHHHSSYNTVISPLQTTPNIGLPNTTTSTPQTSTTTTTATTTNFFPMNCSAFFTYPTAPSNTSQSTIDELQRLVTYQHHHQQQQNQLLLPTTLPHPHTTNLINNTLPPPATANSLPLFTTLLQQHASTSSSSLLSPLLNPMMPAAGSSSSSSSSSLLHHHQPAAAFPDRLWDWTSINPQQHPTRDFNPSPNFN